MVNAKSLIAFVLPLIAVVVCFGEPPRELTDSIAPESVVQDLIRRLNSDSYPERAKAAEQLVFIGEPALPAIRRAIADAKTLELQMQTQRVNRLISDAARQSKTTGMPLILLLGDEFQMGSPEKERDRNADETAHTVTINRPYLLGKYEVTQGEYWQVMKQAPSGFLTKELPYEKVAERIQNRPVDAVSWYDAIHFCNTLSQRDGLAPYYELKDISKNDMSIVAAQVEVLGGLGYRLPTEAEWEYAARAGSDGTFGPNVSGATPYGNYQYRTVTGYGSTSRTVSKKATVAIGSYSENRFGFHDMHGNVAEWCYDWYSKSYYDESPKTNPKGPTTGDHRVLRGGSWLVNASNCRCAARFWYAPGQKKYFIGFRVARTASKYLVEK